MKKTLPTKKHTITLLVILICALYALAGSLINIHRFKQFDLGYYDFGIFEVSLWKVSQFQLPIIDHFLVPGKINLADHFTPSLYLLSPLYWIYPESEVILIAQSIIVALSGFVLYKIGQKLLKSDLVSASVVIAYFLYAGLQNAVYSDFHELTVLTLPLMVAYWAIVTKNKKMLYILFFIILGLKESLFILGLGLAFFIYWYRKEWTKTALFMAIFSVLYGLLTITFIIPYLSGGTYGYAPDIPLNILDLLSSLVLPVLKVKTVFLTFLSFLFLPVAYLPSLMIVCLNLATRFLSAGEIRWDLGLHYNAEIAPTLAVGTIITLSKIRKFFKIKSYQFNTHYLLAGGLVFTSLMLHQFVLRGPIALSYHPDFYQTTKNMSFLEPMIEVVPQNATVVAQNNLASRFLHQPVWILRENYENYNAEYILIDVRPGQKPANHLGIKDVNLLLTKLKQDRNYTIVYETEEQFVFKRK